MWDDPHSCFLVSRVIHSGLGFLLLQEFGPFVKSILILDLEGKRVASKFYADDWPTNEDRRTFEKNVFTRTHMKDARTEGAFMYNFYAVFICVKAR